MIYHQGQDAITAGVYTIHMAIKIKPVIYFKNVVIENADRTNLHT